MGNATNKYKYQLYRATWSLPNSKESTSSIEPYCIGSVINICSGKSNFGDLCIDLHQELKPDLVADCFHLPLQRNSFDTLLVDPPYSYFNRFKWIYRMADIARKRVILSAGQVLVVIPKFKLVDIVAVITGSAFFVRLWYIYDRIQYDL